MRKKKQKKTKKPQEQIKHLTIINNCLTFLVIIYLKKFIQYFYKNDYKTLLTLYCVYFLFVLIF